MFHVEPRGASVSVLKMDDGKVNAIGPDFLREFPSAWTSATRDGRAVVLAGNAKAFGAGLNLKVLPGLERHEMIDFAAGFMSMFGLILSHDRPVVAAVDGPALAGGAIIALAADFRLVGPRARIGVTEVPVGIPFPDAVATLVRAKLPANEWPTALLRGAIREGAQCVATGWAQELHPSETLVDAAVALAAELAEHNPRAFGPAKRAMHADLAAAMAGFGKEQAERWIDELTSEETMGHLLRGFERATSRK